MFRRILIIFAIFVLGGCASTKRLYEGKRREPEKVAKIVLQKATAESGGTFLTNMIKFPFGLIEVTYRGIAGIFGVEFDEGEKFNLTEWDMRCSWDMIPTYLDGERIEGKNKKVRYLEVAPGFHTLHLKMELYRFQGVTYVTTTWKETEATVSVDAKPGHIYRLNFKESEGEYMSSDSWGKGDRKGYSEIRKGGMEVWAEDVTEQVKQGKSLKELSCIDGCR